MSSNSNILIYGLENASHDFTQPESLGKNIFTNAFPISLAQYLSNFKQVSIPVIKATLNDDNKIITEHEHLQWNEIIGTDSTTANFLFEETYNGYKPYTNSIPNKSDIVISDENEVHTRALEVKLMVVPNSQTANKPHDEQSCELVVRPPSIEQLAFSIANSYGQSRRSELLRLISASLVTPMDYHWNDEDWMKTKIPNIVKAADEIVKSSIESQTPFILTAIWRTEGQKPILERNAFDVFVWTDMAFLQLFINKMRSRTANSQRRISRPERSAIWLISSLFDYAAQNTLDFSKHHSRITYGTQTDKAGAFAGDAPYEHLLSDEFLKPRILRNELENIVSETAFEYLMPERRLDSTLLTQHLFKIQTDEI
ncbi:HindVP family restriction endonuclease [Allofustis seminis]|uniref:HindVP family restriction endonuclease n=1 Tax=Allofustis seminis TaxID=166939 RepID=UPI0003820B76|nr:HindVP family restriction endonuclease [Allofustis seminis]